MFKVTTMVEDRVNEGRGDVDTLVSREERGEAAGPIYVARWEENKGGRRGVGRPSDVTQDSETRPNCFWRDFGSDISPRVREWWWLGPLGGRVIALCHAFDEFRV